jgi:hypothetical protein
MPWIFIAMRSKIRPSVEAAQENVNARAAIDYWEAPAMRFYVLLKGTGFTNLSGALIPSVDGQATKFGFLATRVVDAPDAQRGLNSRLLKSVKMRKSVPAPWEKR